MHDEYRVSDAVVLKSVPKDADENPYGITEVMLLQPGRPSVVMFGVYGSMRIRMGRRWFIYWVNIWRKNAILNLIKRTVNGDATTQYAIADLVSGDGIDFQTLLVGGRNFYNNMYGDLHVKRPQNLKHGRQR